MDNAKFSHRGLRSAAALLAAGVLALVPISQAWAGLTDLATAPLATSSGTLVRPNILFTLDNSGSMAWDLLPDYTGGGMGTTYPHCKPSKDCGNGQVANPRSGVPPFNANGYNGLAYNPAFSYAPPLNYDGSSKTSMTCVNTGGTAANCTAANGYAGGWTAVKEDGYGVQWTSTINLTSGYNETYYCSSSGACKQNGIDNNNPFFEDVYGSGNPNNFAYPGQDYNYGTISGFYNFFGGAMNGPTSTTASLYGGAFANASPTTTTISLNGPTVSISGSTVTLTYTSRTPSTPAIVTGDLISVTGANCSPGFTVTGVPLTVTSATTVTYASPGGGTTKKTCGTVTVTHTTTPAVTPPSIASSAGVVTVNLTGCGTASCLKDASGHTLVVGDVIQVSGAGCDTGYAAVNASVTSVNAAANTFTYTAQGAISSPSSTACAIGRTSTTAPTSPGISINGNVVTVLDNGCCSTTGTANTLDAIVRTGDFIWAWCPFGDAYSTGGPIPVTVTSANSFTYTGTAGGGTNSMWGCWFWKTVYSTAPTLQSFNTATNKTGAPYYFVIIPVEFCDSQYLTNCVASSAPTGNFTYPAPTRYCSSTAAAALPPGDPGAQTSASGSVPCQGLFASSGTTTYTSVRYGLFYRIDVKPTRTAPFGNEVMASTVFANGANITFNNQTILDRSARTDCAAVPNCTYAEEMTNFANWYAYYRTRIMMMKTSAARAFQTMDSRYRIGFATINESWVVPTATTGGQWLPVNMFDTAPGGQKNKWYNAMFSINPGNSTPLREAVARAGRYFAGLHGLPGDSTHMTDDPMEYSCQQNFLLITTDGYWNGTTSAVVDLKGVQIGNTDNNASNPLSTRAEGVYDGGVTGASTTLADTAFYYYMNDLRNMSLGNCVSGATGAALCSVATPDPLDNVPTGAKDPVAGGLMWQHMSTFSLGLASGLMLYQPDYETSLTGDVANIVNGASNCPFSGSGVCNWPLPVADSPTALDDLWHAAVNGRGTFYNARDPVSLAKGLSGALSGMSVTTGSAAASATSSPNITQTDRSIFSSTYRTIKWDGEVVAQLLDPSTGNVPPATVTALTATLSSITLTGNAVVVNMIGHGLITGDMIQVSNTATGTCDPAFNTGGQSVAVSVIDASNFAYPSPSPLGASANKQCLISKAGIAWSAQKQLDIKVNSATDPEILTRFIYTDDTAQVMPLNTTNSSMPMNGLKEFRYSLLPAADQALFDNHCTSTTGAVIMSQCTAVNLTPTQITNANSGYNLINYLRGNQTLEQTTPNPSYRPRDHFLGDTVNARPAYVRAPTFSFVDPVTPLYSAFQSANQTRLATIYVAANDGMLHAFDAGQCASQTSCSVGTGNERWAYVPHETLYNLYKLADVNYGSNHQYFVDGSPETMDIYVNASYALASGLTQGWHTILVAGLNGGGRGYYALDITDPSVPIGLWDICASSTLCTFQDTDMGYTYGNPVITKRSSDGKWVVLVTSGYNNVTPGTGQGFLYVLDAITGVPLQKIPTGSGNTTTPSGLARIAAWSDNSTQDNTSRFVYGGDLNGDVWRFDLGGVGAVGPLYPALSPQAERFTTLYSDAAGTQPQPITTRPELGDPWTTPGSINSITATGQPAIFIGTGRYLGVSDLTNTQVQTIYALKDDFSRAGNIFPSVPTVPNPRGLPSGGFLQGMVVQTISTTTGSSSNNPVDWSTKEGWYADFPGSGERNNLDPQLVLGTLIVITNVPSASGGACVTGGTSFMYQFNFRNGNNIPGSVARTSLGNAISVGFVALRLPSGALKVIVTNATGSKVGLPVNVSGSTTTRNVSWRELLQ